MKIRNDTSMEKGILLQLDSPEYKGQIYYQMFIPKEDGIPYDDSKLQEKIKLFLKNELNQNILWLHQGWKLVYHNSLH